MSSDAGRSHHNAPDEAADLRYGGFQQTGNIRSYRFEAVTPGNPGHYSITVDIALLARHHVGIQEAPALCLRKLTAALKDPVGASRHELDEGDLLAFTSARAAALERKKPRRAFGGRRRDESADAHGRATGNGEILR